LFNRNDSNSIQLGRRHCLQDADRLRCCDAGNATRCETYQYKTVKIQRLINLWWSQRQMKDDNNTVLTVRLDRRTKPEPIQDSKQHSLPDLPLNSSNNGGRPEESRWKDCNTLKLSYLLPAGLVWTNKQTSKAKAQQQPKRSSSIGARPILRGASSSTAHTHTGNCKQMRKSIEKQHTKHQHSP